MCGWLRSGNLPASTWCQISLAHRSRLPSASFAVPREVGFVREPAGLAWPSARATQIAIGFVRRRRSPRDWLRSGSSPGLTSRRQVYPDCHWLRSAPAICAIGFVRGSTKCDKWAPADGRSTSSDCQGAGGDRSHLHHRRTGRSFPLGPGHDVVSVYHPGRGSFPSRHQRRYPLRGTVGDCLRKVLRGDHVGGQPGPPSEAGRR